MSVIDSLMPVDCCGISIDMENDLEGYRTLCRHCLRNLIIGASCWVYHFDNKDSSIIHDAGEAAFVNGQLLDYGLGPISYGIGLDSF